MQFTTIIFAAFVATMAAAVPARDHGSALFVRSYTCGGDCDAGGSALCTSSNAPGCAVGDCDCCCEALRSSDPTASLPPVGK